MSSELIVTSAARGLQAGRSGFTTVLRTRGMHPDLVSRLEAASAYRHIFPQGDPRNPVILSYTRKPSAVGDTWVLSRIGDAGTDYTGRSNKIAHHIALQATDIAALSGSNPAAVLESLVANHGLLQKWDGEPRENPTPPLLPNRPMNPSPCARWGSLCGDPGWAGVLVERAINRESTWVIAPHGTDFVGLFAEALALVNPAQRWQISFTTYSLRGDEGLWLGTTAGSPEAEAARAQHRVAVIDLTARSVASAASPYVLAARGQAGVPWQRSTAVAPALKAASPPQIVAAPDAQPATRTFENPGTAHAHPGMPPALRLPPVQGTSRPPDMDEWEEVPLPSRKWVQLGVLASLAALFLLGSVVLFSNDLLPRNPTQSSGQQAASGDGPGGKPVDESDSQKKPPVVPGSGQASSVPALSTELAPVPRPANSTATTPTPNEISTTAPQAPPDPNPSGESSPQQREAFELITQSASEAYHLPQVSLLGCELKVPVVLLSWTDALLPDSVHNVRFSLPDKPIPITLKPNAPSEGLASWRCCVDQPDGPPKLLGDFEISATQLVFRPDMNAPPDLAGLPFLPLIIDKGTNASAPTWVQLMQPVPFRGVHMKGDPEPAEVVDIPLIVGTYESPTIISFAIRDRLFIRDATITITADNDAILMSPYGTFDFNTVAKLQEIRFNKEASLAWWRPSKANTPVAEAPSGYADLAHLNWTASKQGVDQLTLALNWSRIPEAATFNQDTNLDEMVKLSDWIKDLERVLKWGFNKGKVPNRIEFPGRDTREKLVALEKAVESLVESLYKRPEKTDFKGTMTWENAKRRRKDRIDDLTDRLRKCTGFRSFAEGALQLSAQDLLEPKPAPSDGKSDEEKKKQNDLYDDAMMRFRANSASVENYCKNDEHLRLWVEDETKGPNGKSSRDEIILMWLWQYFYRIGDAAPDQLAPAGKENLQKAWNGLLNAADIQVEGVVACKWDPSDFRETPAMSLPTTVIASSRLADLKRDR